MIAFIDLETSGFSITKNGVCEIAVMITDYQLNHIAELHSYIKPYYQESGEPIIYTDAAFQVHGLSVEFLEANGIEIATVLGELIILLEDHQVKTIIGHNSNAFDVPRLEYLLNRFHGMTIKNLLFADTLKIAKSKYDLHSYSLEHLCKVFGITNEKEHSAMGDVKATIEIYKKLV